ncbi:MAG: hypothetical protein OXT73_08725 [Bacteroidota bacterium]|nr:hypothetical protein [Bacteroidota bacterium]
MVNSVAGGRQVKGGGEGMDAAQNPAASALRVFKAVRIWSARSSVMS